MDRRLGDLHGVARQTGVRARRLPTHASKSPRPWGRALAWLLFLGPFFFASYGFATWVTSQRTDVGVVVFDWERHIPFLPWTIVPYWLIDGLYAISLFLCATRIQLDTHAKRLLTAQGVAVTCFLLFPLRFSFERPPVEGIFGVFFDVLGQFDKPFNQAPSLHIALMVLLWVVYLRALPKAWHGLVHGTFALIGVSVLTTWQHHFIDVPTGLALGGLCLWLWPDDGPSPLAGARLTSDPSRRRLGGYYALGSVACVFLAGLGDAALWLCWPAGALALVAGAYLAARPRRLPEAPGRHPHPRRLRSAGPLPAGRLAQFTGLDPQPAARCRDRAGPAAGRACPAASIWIDWVLPPSSMSVPSCLAQGRDDPISTCPCWTSWPPRRPRSTPPCTPSAPPESRAPYWSAARWGSPAAPWPWPPGSWPKGEPPRRKPPKR